MRKILLSMMAIMVMATMSFAETKENSINEKEAVVAIHTALTNDGVKISKYLIDRVMDKAHDLSFAALSKGQAIKVQGLGTLEVRNHIATAYSVPDGNGSFRTGITPAGKHVTFVIAKKLKKSINTLIE